MTIATANPFAGLEAVVSENVPLAKHTWYKLGGPARYYIEPDSIATLQAAVKRCLDNAIPIYVLGLGANLLVSDQGVNAAVFRFSREFFNEVRLQPDSIYAGAGVDLQKLIVRSVRAGLGGIETLAGIPGTIGGAVRMNAGGKFGDIGSVIQSVMVMDDSGEVYERTRDDLVFEYRSTNISARFILGATLTLEQDDPDALSRRMKEVWMYKNNSQPLNTKNAGCVFKNPRGLSAGAMIDKAGLKGHRIGGAEVSPKHANFIVAHPGAKAADVQALISHIRDTIFQRENIHLETEVRIWP